MASNQSPSTTGPILDNAQPPTMPLVVDPSTGRPPGAAEPQIRHIAHYPTFSPSQASAQSLLLDASHGTRPASPADQSIPRTASPSQISTDLPGPQSSAPSGALKWEVLQYITHKTYGWVLAGILFMLLGIGLAHAIILPRIHTCPPSAFCPGTYDPITGNAFQLLQAFMSYWLKAGVMISSIGILKLSAYQAWFILMHQGNTIKNLDLTLGAIRGSLNDACLLLFRKRNHLLSIFVFSLLGIGAAISLVSGLSITKKPTTLDLMFTFNATTATPDSLNARGHLNNAEQLEATSKVITWGLRGNKDHDGALRGSLVAPDSRSIVASKALPGGPKITGSFECKGWDNYTKTDSYYEIWVNGTQYIAPALSLYISPTKIGLAAIEYLWISNTTGLIPNATTTSDGKLHFALCMHRVAMEPEEPRKEGVQYLTPQRPRTTGCKSDDTNVCVADSVSMSILNWWGGPGTSFMHIRCRGGVLGPLPSSTDAEMYCPITQELWKETVVSMLDGIMQASPRSDAGIQNINAVVEGMDRSRWWLNAIIPALTLLLYLGGLAFTWKLSQGDQVFKELNLAEVVKAAQTDHIHDLVLAGELKKVPIRYHSDVGFIDGRRRPL